MRSIKRFGILISLIVVLVSFIMFPVSVLADTVTPEPGISIISNYPKIEVVSGDTAIFNLTIQYTDENTGATPKAFDVIVAAPARWTANVLNSAGTRIVTTVLTPGTPDLLTLNLVPLSSSRPEPGEYPVTIQVTSGDLKASISLMVVVTAKYALEFKPAGNVYNITVTAGKTQAFAALLTNAGTSPLTNIFFTPEKPTDWRIDFPQNVVDSLAAQSTQTMDIMFTTPSNTISGDYMITLTAKSDQVTSEPLQIRVTVETSSIWGWVGVAVIIIVLLGLAFLFARFSRR